MKALSNNLATNLYKYIISDESLKDEIRSIFGIQSVLTDGKRNYAFIGNGCGITYLKIDRRSKKAIELNSIVYEVRRRFNSFVMLKYFSNDELIHFHRIGCPVIAILQQDITIQQLFYDKVVEYGKNVLGIKKLRYISNLD